LVTEANNIEVVPVSVEIAASSARYRHGMGLPTVDSVILATFLNCQCDKMLTTDNHFHVVNEQTTLPVEFLV